MTISHGVAPISAELAAKILQEFRQPSQSLAQPLEVKDELTPREVEILELVVAGASNKEITEALCITENTVKTHMSNILEKLHLQNRVQAAVYAVRQGLVEDTP
jgi:two-component system nitrate/nitrite response regulator NarL